MNRNAIIFAVAVGGALALLAIVGAISYSPSASAQNGGGGQGNNGNNSQGNVMMNGQGEDQSPPFIYKLNKKFYDYSNGVFKVRTGAGGYVSPMTVFFPQFASIKVGETVVFYNPTSVAEPHTVTFVLNANTSTDIMAPFVAGGNATFTPPNPNANAQAVTMPGPGGNTMIIGANNRSVSPVVIDSQGKVTYLPLNANYTLDGTEKYVNSGWIWPKGLAPPGLPPIDSFSVKFTNAGTYHYLCEIHPWMSGTVDVK